MAGTAAFHPQTQLVELSYNRTSSIIRHSGSGRVRKFPVLSLTKSSAHSRMANWCYTVLSLELHASRSYYNLSYKMNTVSIPKSKCTLRATNMILCDCLLILAVCLNTIGKGERLIQSMMIAAPVGRM